MFLWWINSLQGCDASVLLDHPGSERRADASKTLRGFQVIDDIKTEVERKCPNTVSCADILTAAARDATILSPAPGDATHLHLGSVPYWMVPYGRKDGRVSRDQEAQSSVPMGRENVTYLLEFFQSKGLNVLDLVVLSGIHHLLIHVLIFVILFKINAIVKFNSTKFNELLRREWCFNILSKLLTNACNLITGAHTIGRSTCGAIQHRLFDFKGTGKPDPSLSPKYLNFLRRKCRWASEYVELDAITPRSFDAMYYKNLQHNMGLLTTDQMLASDSRTSDVVAALASEPSIFYSQFALSMQKLGNTQVLTGAEGEIRANCNFVNP